MKGSRCHPGQLQHICRVIFPIPTAPISSAKLCVICIVFPNYLLLQPFSLQGSSPIIAGFSWLLEFLRAPSTCTSFPRRRQIPCWITVLPSMWPLCERLCTGLSGSAECFCRPERSWTYKKGGSALQKAYDGPLRLRCIRGTDSAATG